MEAITTTEALKRKMEIDLKDIETKANNIVTLENKLMIMKSQSEEGKLTVEMAETRFSDVPAGISICHFPVFFGTTKN